MTSRSASQLALGGAPTTGPNTGGPNPIRIGTGTAGTGTAATTLIAPNRRTDTHEYDFSSGFGNRHAYASIGLTKDPDLYSSETGGSEASTSTRPPTAASAVGGRALPKQPSRSKLPGGNEPHDINTLAKEVAAVLQRQTSRGVVNVATARGEKDGLPPPENGSGSDGGDPPPPVYRS